MLGFGQPDVLLKVTPLEYQAQNLFFGAAIVLFVFTALASFWRKTGRV